MEKAILLYLVEQQKISVSLYSFDRIVVNTFKSKEHPGVYLNELIAKGFLVKGTQEDSEAMPDFYITQAGSEEASRIVQGYSVALSKIAHVFQDVSELGESKVSIPFCSIPFGDYLFRFLVDLNSSKIYLWKPVDLQYNIKENVFDLNILQTNPDLIRKSVTTSIEVLSSGLENQES